MHLLYILNTLYLVRWDYKKSYGAVKNEIKSVISVIPVVPYI